MMPNVGAGLCRRIEADRAYVIPIVLTHLANWSRITLERMRTARTTSSQNPSTLAFSPRASSAASRRSRSQLTSKKNSPRSELSPPGSRTGENP